MSNLLFVYGTLKKGFSNCHWMAGSKYLGTAKLKAGFTLYSNGHFPMLVRTKKNDIGVSGELYEVSDLVLKQLDRFEGHPTFYERIEEEFVPESLESLDPEISSRINAGVTNVYLYKGSVAKHKHIGQEFLNGDRNASGVS